MPVFVPPHIIGHSKAILQALDLARRVAMTAFSVFLLGESGVGKSLIARYIHSQSARKDKPFLDMNCAGLPETMIESEMFGHEKGAFTGATTKRTGRFEDANGGTLFLDEIGDMPPNQQVKLLRVLQEGVFERLGSNRPIKANVRILAATNQDILKLIDEGRFREDLFHRLNEFPLTVPPLRERSEDIPLLAEYILTQKSPNKKYFHSKAMQALTRHSYSRNNIRELENVIKPAIVLSGSTPCIKPEHLTFLPPSGLLQEEEIVVQHVIPVIDDSNLNIAHNLGPQLNDLAERAMIINHGVVTQAAKVLGISPHHLKNILSGQVSAPQICAQYSKALESCNEIVDEPVKQKVLPKQKDQLPLEPDKLSAKEEQILALVQKEGKVTNKMIQQKFKISHGTAHKFLSQLVAKQILQATGKSRNINYVLSG